MHILISFRLLVKMTKDPHFRKKNPANSNKSLVSRTLEDLGGLSFEDLGMCFLHLEQQEKERRAEKGITRTFFIGIQKRPT